MKKLIDKMNHDFAAKLETAKEKLPSTVHEIKQELKKHSFVSDIPFGIVISINSICLTTTTTIFNQFES